MKAMPFNMFRGLYRLLRHLNYAWSPIQKMRAEKLTQGEINWLVLEEFDWKVAHGPFRGMKYLGESRCSALAPKILGTYEQEIYPVLEEVIKRRYDTVLDVGSAEGYYVVGLALRIPTSTVVAFDVDPIARKLLGDLARLNAVHDRIVIREGCSHDALQEYAGRRVFLLCDIDGGEVPLLDPEKAPALRGMDMLVETHDGPNSTTVQDLLIRRFVDSHEATVYCFQERDEAQAKRASWLRTPRVRRLAVEEGRVSGFTWLWLRSRRSEIR